MLVRVRACAAACVGVFVCVCLPALQLPRDGSPRHACAARGRRGDWATTECNRQLLCGGAVTSLVGRSGRGGRGRARCVGCYACVF